MKLIALMCFGWSLFVLVVSLVPPYVAVTITMDHLCAGFLPVLIGILAALLVGK